MKVIYTTILLLFLFSFNVFSVNENSYEIIEQTKEALFEEIDADIKAVLEEMGIYEGTIDEINNFSIEKISSYFKTTLKEKAESCFKSFFLLLSTIIIMGSISLMSGSNDNEGFVSLICVSVVSLLAVNILSDSYAACISALKMSGNFMITFIPVYTLLISFAGNAASALTYNSFVMAFAQLLSGGISSFASDIIGVLFCLSIALPLNENMNTNRFINFVNKSSSLVLGFSSCIFTGLLSIKNVLSASVDSLSVKGIRFLISSLIPIVGSSISEAYSSLLGSINLIKGSVAFVGILVIIIINLPIITETLMYNLALNALSYISDMMNMSRVGETLRCISSTVRILLLLCVFEMFILIISTGIVISVKSGA